MDSGLVAQIPYQLSLFYTMTTILHTIFAMGGIVRVSHPWPNFPSFSQIDGQKWPDLFKNEIVGMAMAIVAIVPSETFAYLLDASSLVGHGRTEDSATADMSSRILT